MVRGIFLGIGRGVVANWHHILAGSLLLLWCVPYFTTGNKVEWGDFGLFAQGYEAIRITILEYGQFPWWNPWIAGGTPLYANPQIGVFSIQTPLVLLLGTPMGLKTAIVVYSVAGYASMYTLLRAYVKTPAFVAALLGVIWIFSSFFVAHVPTHFTFVWYMLAPLYVYLALTIRSWKGGAILGALLALMALGAVHYALLHIGIVVAAILTVRFIVQYSNWRSLLGIIFATGVVFAALAGHRILFTLQNLRDFTRTLTDPAAEPMVSVLGIIMPFPWPQPWPIIRFPQAPFGYSEVTATIGIFATFAVLVGILFIAFKVKNASFKRVLHQLAHTWRAPVVVILLALLIFTIGLGSIHPFAPYSLLENLPVFGQMRVSSRWFIWVSLAFIVFIAMIIRFAPKKSFVAWLLSALVIAGTAELFFTNAGYQYYYFINQPATSQQSASSHTFAQTSMFGAATTLPDGTRIPKDTKMPGFFREYEATSFNLGVIQANDALVYKMPLHQTPRCGWEQACGFVLSNNANVAHWSPNKIILTRTAPGDISLNTNNSSYILINGNRTTHQRVAEPFKEFIITDTSQTITITVSPDIITLLPGR